MRRGGHGARGPIASAIDVYRQPVGSGPVGLGDHNDMGTMRNLAGGTAVAISSLFFNAIPASAHPHVWVIAESTVEFAAGGLITGLTHKWTFDEFYTAMATEGLDKTEKGKFTRAELAELAKTNMDGLKEFAYFTFPKLAGQDLELGEPSNSYLEVTGGKLSLNFTLPLKKPVLAEAKGFSFAVIDPSFFIAFEWAKTEPIKVGKAAPTGCIAKVQSEERDAKEAGKLGEAFAKEFGSVPSSATSSEHVVVACAPGAGK